MPLKTKTEKSVVCVLFAERRAEILEMLNHKGTVKVTDLVRHYSVGKETIRRDLKALAEDWNVEVIYGGARLKAAAAGVTVDERSLEQKRTLNAELKMKIAKRAAELIQPGDLIALNTGSTVECILDYIADKTPLSILTVSISVAAKASAIPGVEVYIPSGKIRNKTGMIIGADANEYINQFVVQKCFFGVNAISLGSQITHPCPEEVPGNRALLSVSEKVYLLADHTKFDKKSLYKMAGFEQMSAVITDRQLSDSYQIYFENYGVEMLYAGE